MKKRGLIVVDLQNEYLPTGKLPLTGIEAAAANAARVIADARAKGGAGLSHPPRVRPQRGTGIRAGHGTFK